MARHLLVTLADERFLDQARALFACVHFDAGWSGDLMLLAHEIPDTRLAPFRERGILVRPCETWFRGEPGEHFHPEAVLGKLEIFHPDFRRWQNVLFLDGDTLFWSSLERLATVRGLHAVSERRPLAGQFSRRDRNPALARELEARFDLQRPAFNSGLLAFSTGVIRDETCARLRGLFLRYRELQAHAFGDQPALNLHFYGHWRRLPDFYAAIRDHSAAHFFLAEDELRMIGKHFAGHPRPWDPGHPLREAWLCNLARFESLDARKPRPPRAAWSGLEVRRYEARLYVRRWSVLARRGAASAWRRLLRAPAAKRLRWLARRLRR